MNALSLMKSSTPLALLLFLGCGPQEAPTAAAPEPRPVRFAEARAAGAASGQVYSGTVRAAVRSRLAFQVPGRLVERAVELGKVVRRGDVVARLDPTDYRLRSDQAGSSLDLANARLREAEAAYGRIERLYAGDHATRAQLDSAVAALEVARSSVDGAQRGLDIARRDLDHTRLTAPRGGTVVDLFAEAGEVVAAGQAVATVAEAGDLELEWTVPENAVRAFSPGLAVEAWLPALGRRLPAVVTEIGTSPRDGGAAYPVIARLDAVDDAPLAGMAAEIRTDVETGAGSILVPADAVSGDPTGYFVFVIEDGSAGTGGPGKSVETRTVSRRPVTVGTLRPAGLEVVSGLVDGDLVVTAGLTFLADGERVSLLRGDPLAELPPAVTQRATAGLSETGR